MTLRPYKLFALLRKDFSDTFKNMNCLIVIILPLFFVALYRSLSFGDGQMPLDYVLTLGLQMNLSLVPISTLATMVAEEKEKNTLRTLMLSNVTAAEFLVSKLMVGYVMMQFVNTAIYLMCSQPLNTYPFFFLVMTLGSLCILLIGATIGIVSKNQMSTGIASAPAALLLLIPSVFSALDPEGFFAKIARLLPNAAMLSLYSREGSALYHCMVMLAWLAITGLVFSLVYRRTRFDQ